MDSTEFLDDLETTVLILTEKEELSERVSSLEGISLHTEKFSLVLDNTTFNWFIFALSHSDSELAVQPLYKTLNIKEEFSRCLVLEWRYKSEKFSCYVIYPSSMKDDNVRFDVDDDRPNSFDRETFFKCILLVR